MNVGYRDEDEGHNVDHDDHHRRRPPTLACVTGILALTSAVMMFCLLIVFLRTHCTIPASSAAAACVGPRHVIIVSGCSILPGCLYLLSPLRQRRVDALNLFIFPIPQHLLTNHPPPRSLLLSLIVLAIIVTESQR
jgi:hypothetical protein